MSQMPYGVWRFREKGFPMKPSKKFETHHAAHNGFSIHPKQFVFFDRKTGTRRFEVKAGEDGSLPTEQAVSLLAIHCVARQQMPRDFSVMVSLGDDLVDGLAGRAAKLIRSCSHTKSPVVLSRRQQEVLNGVAQNLSNKEIANKLNVSVRTIKFHVSALLEKFDVRGRVDLMLEAADLLSPEAVHKRNGNSQHLPGSDGGVAPAIVSASARPRLLAPLDRRSSR
jgi:DNA-binding CsgD family transcriptional regulator